MGKVIEDADTSRFVPTAQIKVDGAVLKGKLLSKRDVKTKWGNKPVYSLSVLDATCSFLRGKEEVFPEAGSKIEVFAPTRLVRQLEQVSMQSIVTIKYLGKKENGKFNPAHAFHVEVE